MGNFKLVGPRVIATVALVCGLSPAYGAVFTVGPGSSLDLKGSLTLTIQGVPASGTLTEQAEGSLHTTLGGSLNATTTGSTLNFPGGSAITAQNSGNWQPSGLPAAFGFMVDISFPGVSETLRFIGDLRDLTFDIAGSTVLSGSGNQSFDTDGLIFSATTGTLDLKGFSCPGGTPPCTELGSFSGPGDDGGPPDRLAPGAGSLTQSGATQLLSFPVSVTESQSQSQEVTVPGIPVPITVTASGVFSLTGNVVASAIPEPSTWALLCFGLGIIVMARRQSPHPL